MKPHLLLHRKLGRKHVFIAITDLCAGKRNRFTLYKIELYGDKQVDVIGREQTVGEFKRLVANLVKEGA